MAAASQRILPIADPPLVEAALVEREERAAAEVMVAMPQAKLQLLPG